MARELFESAVSIVHEPDLVKKTDLAMETARAWLKRQMGKGRFDEAVLPQATGSPGKA